MSVIRQNKQRNFSLNCFDPPTAFFQRVVVLFAPTGGRGPRPHVAEGYVGQGRVGALAKTEGVPKNNNTIPLC